MLQTALSDAERSVVAAALAEDFARSDVTTMALVPAAAPGSAEIRAKQAGVVAGVAVAEEAFRQVDPLVRFSALARDGERVVPGRVVARIEGPLLSLLTGERVAVNFLQRMSGIATFTAQFVAAVSGTNARILATRKTAPGLRPFDLAAVRAGGGGVHRESLSAQVLVKENHLRAARAAGTARTMSDVVARVVAAAAAADGSRPKVGIEAADLAEFRAALVAGVDVVLLDNFTPEACAGAVAIRAAVFPAGDGPELEASGGITLATVAEYAATGVERISIGALTHSAPALDLSMKVAG
ncbi:MAG: carboxylating nicotinate-nucleotide diphosphorylase [Planctomycetes bacterium]|nr:carboxylating nicotinate-nucleotide diphosphorylase [Planctomycetota bacterium]